MAAILKGQRNKIEQIWLKAIEGALKNFIAGELTPERMNAIAFDSWEQAFGDICEETFEVFHRDAWMSGDCQGKIALAETILPDICFERFLTILANAYSKLLDKLTAKTKKGSA